MSNSVAPRLRKWPFVLGDLLLIGLATVIAFRDGLPLGLWQACVCLVATFAGAWLCAWPFLREFQAAVQLHEADNLATTVTQINNLNQLRTELGAAAAQWQGVQEHSAQTLHAAREVTDRMQSQVAEFGALLHATNESEKQHLRLQVEKLRRAERDWLQATVHVLDHVVALYAAACRTGQPALVAQLKQFQGACRDAVRRLGLLSFAPEIHAPFDPQTHQLADAEANPAEAAVITEVLALGYTYQGELVRRALVRIGPVQEGPPEAAPLGTG